MQGSGFRSKSFLEGERPLRCGWFTILVLNRSLRHVQFGLLLGLAVSRYTLTPKILKHRLL